MAKSRGKIFIDPVVQTALVKRLVLHWFIFFGLSMLSLLAMETMLGDPGISYAERFSTLWSKYGLLVLIMGAIMPMFVYDTIKLSHRFAGPIFRLRMTFKSLAQNSPPSPMKFREGDFWNDIAADFNVVQARLERAERRVAELEAAQPNQSQNSEDHHSEDHPAAVATKN